MTLPTVRLRIAENRLKVRTLPLFPTDAVQPPANGISTDNAIPRWDGTDASHLQNSGVLIDDNDRVTFPEDILLKATTDRTLIEWGTQNLTTFTGQGNSKTTAIHLNPGSGTLPTDTVTEFVAGRTSDQAFGGNYGRISLSTLGSDHSGRDVLHAEYGGTVTPTRFDFGVGIENPASTFTSFNFFSAFYASGGGESSNQGAVGFGNDVQTSQRNIVSLLRASIGSAGSRDSHALLWEGKANDGTERAVWWRQWVDVTSNAGASTFMWQKNLNAAGWVGRMALGDGGLLQVTANTALSATASADAVLQLVGAPATVTNLLIDGFAGAPTVTGRRASGTLGTPTATASGSTLLNLYGVGYTGSAYGSAGASIVFESSELWSGSAQGARIRLLTTSDTTSTLVDRWNIQSAGHLVPVTTSSYDLGLTGSRVRDAFIDTLTLTNALGVANGGSGAATLTGLLQGNGTSAFTAISNSSTVGQVLRVTGAATYAWGALDLSDTDAITGDLPFANLTQGAALTVLANATNGTADFAALAAGTDNQVLRRSGTALAFGAVNLASSDAVTGDLPFANLAQGSALSVLGVTGNSTADNASIAAGSDHNILRRSGTAVAFGTIDLSQSGAVGSSVLAGVNGGTGLSTAAVGDIIYASATTPTWSRLADVATGSVLVSGGVNTAPAWSASPTLTTSLTVPVIIGGTGTTSTAEIRATSNSGGTTGADVVFTSGNNGALEMFRVRNQAGVGYLGLNRAAPNYLVQYHAPTGVNCLMQFTQADGGGAGAAAGAYFGLTSGSPRNFRIANLDTVSGSIDFLVNGTSTRAMWIDISGGVTIGTTGTDAGATNLLGNGAIRSNSATAGVGYATGAGGTVTQGAGSGKATGVTLNNVCGQITMNNATLNAGTTVGFTFTNSAVATTDLVYVCIDSGATADSYTVTVTAVGAGSCRIELRNTSASNLGEAVVLSFFVLKAVTS